jgi:hypothetical protein
MSQASLEVHPDSDESFQVRRLAPTASLKDIVQQDLLRKGLLPRQTAINSQSRS